MKWMGRTGGSIGSAGVIILALLVALMPEALWGAEKQKPKPRPPVQAQPPKALKSDSPLHIASDRMEVSQTDRAILFEGHVVVQQDDMTITGDRMRVFAAAGDEGATVAPGSQESTMMDRVDRIEVEGNVKISQKEKVATAEKSIYYHKEKRIVLIGNPVVSQGRDSVRGRVITLYLSEGRSVIEGGDTPVQAVLHPSRKE